MNKYRYNGTIITEQALRNIFNKETRLPEVITTEAVLGLGIDIINLQPHPQYNDLTHTCTEYDDGTNMQAWKVEPITDVVVLEENLQRGRTHKKQAMKAERKAATESTTLVTINAVDYEVDCDAPARSALHQSIDNSALAGLTDTDIVNWKLATGAYQQFTIADLKSIAVQMAVHIQVQYEKEAVLIAQIDAATIDTLDTLTWV